jgi:hypothetical protein
MRETIAQFKKRRDKLLSRACNRQERPAIMDEVRAINEKIRALQNAARRRH